MAQSIIPLIYLFIDWLIDLSNYIFMKYNSFKTIIWIQYSITHFIHYIYATIIIIIIISVLCLFV